MVGIAGLKVLESPESQSRRRPHGLLYQSPRCRRLTLTGLLILCAASSASAHGSDAFEAGASLEWMFDPWISGPILTMALLYAIGELRLRTRRARRPICNAWRSSLFFWGGIVLLAVTLLSPMHELAEQLFTVHMIEHELVMAVAAPLLVLSRPIGVLLWGMPRRLRSRARQVLSSRTLRLFWQCTSLPAVATALHGLAIWVWHVPPLFDATVSDILLHRLQHLSFFLTGILFWWAVMWRSSRGTAAWHLFVTMMHTSILGALIALAPGVLYVGQTHHAAFWGLTPLEDQQLAGILMWVPGGVVYAGAALWFLSAWIKRSSEGGENESRIVLR